MEKIQAVQLVSFHPRMSAAMEQLFRPDMLVLKRIDWSIDWLMFITVKYLDTFITTIPCI